MIDGEVVVLDEQGVSSFARLKAALSEGVPDRLHYYAFDLLHLDGRDLRELPLLERKRRLEQLLAPLPPDHPVRFSDHLIGAGPELHRQACRLGAEGIVAKRVDAPYRSGPRRGLAQGQVPRPPGVRRRRLHHRRRAAGSAWARCCSACTGTAPLAYVGRVGTGWDARTGQVLRDALDPLRVDAAALRAAAERAARRGARWVRPELVAEVRFQTWTADGMLRHASFQGLREDKPATEHRPGAAEPATGPPGRSLAGRSSCTGCGSAAPSGRCWIGPG